MSAGDASNGNNNKHIATSTSTTQNNDATHTDDDDAASDVSTENFSMGERVLLDGRSKAQVAYFGSVHFSHDDDWVGLVFEEPIGKHNGTVAGHEYFKCDSMHGLFVRSHRLQRTDAMGHVTAHVKSPYRLRPKSSSSLHSVEQQDDLSDNIFARADNADPLGFYEAKAGTMRSPDSGEDITPKLTHVVEQMEGARGADLSFASPWIDGATNTHRSGAQIVAPVSATSGAGPRAKLTPSLAKKMSAINKSKPYGITLGYGERDH